MEKSFTKSASPTPFSTFEKLYEATDDKIKRLEFENTQLREDLALERKFRYDAERKIDELHLKLESVMPEPVRRKRKKQSKGVITPFSEYKSDGKLKARAVDPIRSYSDFLAIQEYFLSKNNARDWMLWTVGVSLGLRISDLFSLKISSILNKDGTFRKRLFVTEQKTQKLNSCLITESVIDAVKKYFNVIGWNYDYDSYLFASKKTKSKMCEEYGWKILSDAGKALNLPIVIGSHTMRKSFANIAVCVDKSVVDMNSITKIQGLLNHSDQKVTMRYLGTFQNMFDKARIAVSDFVLGRSDVQELIAGNSHTIDDLVEKLDLFESKYLTKKEEC